MYKTFFGLRAKPFQLNPDPDFFFGSKGHRRAMAYLEYGLHQGEGFIVITGEVGAGKTTLVRNLLRRVPAETIVAAQIVSTQIDADDLLRLAAGSFGIDQTSLEKSALLQKMEEHFRYLHSQGKRALLIVDEAQNLTRRAVEELRMLSNFQIGTRSLVQSFLVGQPEFRDVMQSPQMQQLKQRVIASFHLGPLDASETQAYIEHRLKHVDWKDDPSFSPETFARIHAVTDGIPRRINSLCDRVMLSAYLSQSHQITVAQIDEVASELSEELGTHGPGGQRRTGPAPLALVGAPPDAGLVGGERNLVLGDSSIRGRIEQLEARLALLESTVTTTYSVLQRLLRPAQTPVKKDPVPPTGTSD